jgi:hypothetical protein
VKFASDVCFWPRRLAWLVEVLTETARVEAQSEDGSLCFVNFCFICNEIKTNSTIRRQRVI